jgi:hypothetical protein
MYQTVSKRKRPDFVVNCFYFAGGGVPLVLQAIAFGCGTVSIIGRSLG